MQEQNRELVERIMSLPFLQAEWVLWCLFALSALSLAIILERTFFFVTHKARLSKLRPHLTEVLDASALETLSHTLRHEDSLESNVLYTALAAADDGPEAVEEMVRAAVSRERQRYERSLTVLAIVGSNAPFIGLFGTVLGIIHAFANLATSTEGAGRSVMSGVSEALVATAVGLLVAIPAVAAFSAFKARLRTRVERADQLVRALLARLKSENPSLPVRQEKAA